MSKTELAAFLEGDTPLSREQLLDLVTREDFEARFPQTKYGGMSSLDSEVFDSKIAAIEEKLENEVKDMTIEQKVAYLLVEQKMTPDNVFDILAAESDELWPEPVPV